MSTKVFVGNLAFRTTDQALQEAFSKCGEVKSGVIITRGRRSLGYGFVEFSTADQATSAVDKMNKAEIFGRQIKVEVAKDPNSTESPAPSEGAEPGPAKRRRRFPRGDADGGGSTTTTTTTTTTDAGSNNANEEGGDERGPPRRRRQRRIPRNTDDNDNAPVNANTSAGNKAAAPAAATEKPREKVPSKTTLFVANLPFSVDDLQLAQAFTGTKMKAAHVVRTRTGRSRGYGFVEFENEPDQLEALKLCHNKEVTGSNGNRTISVTISHSVGSSLPAPATNV